MPARLLPPVAVSLLLGSLIGTVAPFLPIFTAAVTTALCLSLVLIRRYWHPAFTTLLFGVFLLGSLAAVVAQQRTVPLVSDKIDIVGEVIEPVKYGKGHAAAVLLLHGAVVDGNRVAVGGRIRLNIRGEAPALVLGDVVRFQSRLRTPHRQLNPAGFDYEAYLRHHGIQAVASVTLQKEGASLEPLLHVSHRGFDRIDNWRGVLRRAALDTLESDAASIYLALITGESGYLAQSVRDAFMTSGTTHILSISGSHLGLIAVVMFAMVRWAILMLPVPWLLRITLRVTPRRLAALATIPVVSFYAMLGGAEVATVRSLIMLGIFLGAILLGRTHHLPTGLAFALLLIVAWDPMAPLDLSFQLSFLSVLVIVLVAQQSHESVRSVIEMSRSHLILDRIKMWLRQACVITLAVTVVTAPLVALHFRQMSWVGLIANIFVIPYVGFVVVPLGLVTALATVLSGSTTLVGASVLETSIDMLVQIISGLGSLPGARWMVASPAVWQVFLFYIGVAVIATRLGGRWATRGAGVVAAMLLVFWAWSPRDVPAVDSVRVTFLDVGQGDAAVVETSTGQVMVIDGGSASDSWDQGRAAVAPYLWDHGIRHLDVVMATHSQLDHVGGLASIVRDFPTREFWTTGVTRDTVFMHRLEETLQIRQVPVRVVSNGDRASMFGPCQIRIANPDSRSPPAQPSSGGKNLNNQSVVARIECGSRSLLFTGDIEEEAEARLVASGLTRADLMKVPHHGSRGSLYEPFLRTVRPELAVVSVGHSNLYGHPTSAMLELYDRLRIPVLRTDRDGAITVVLSDSAQQVSCEAGRRLMRIRPGQRGAWDAERENLVRLWRMSPPCERHVPLTSTS